MKNPRNLALTVFIIVLFISAISVANIIHSTRNNNFESFAEGLECSGQGNIMPQSFDTDLIAPVAPDDTQDLFCSGQGGIAPRPWDDDDKDGD